VSSGKVTPAGRPEAMALTFCWEVVAGRAPTKLPPTQPAAAAVLELLGRHKLLGLWLAESGAPSPTEGIRSAVALQALRTTLTLEAAGRAEEALRTAGLATLCFKGVGLLRAGVYDDPRARPLGDADLLIGRPAEVRGPGHDTPEAPRAPGPVTGPVGIERAIRALTDAGFEPWVAWEPARARWLPAFTLTDVRAPEELEVTLDLHWRIPYASYRSGLDSPDAVLWRGADPDRGVLGAEAHLVVTAEHVVRHLRVTPHVLGIADLVRLCGRIEDPLALREVARERGSLRVVRGLLWFLESELDVQLEGELRATLEVPDRVDPVRAGVLDREGLLRAPEGRREGRIRGLLRQTVLRETPASFFRELLHVLYPSAEWLERRAGSDSGGALRRRLGYWGALVRWLAGRGRSPLSPNQEFEDPRG